MSARRSSAPRDQARQSFEKNLGERWQRKAALEEERKREETRAAAAQRVLDARGVVNRNPFPDPESNSKSDDERTGPAIPRRPWNLSKSQRHSISDSSVEIDAADHSMEPSVAAMPPTPSEAVFSDRHTERTETPMSFYTAGTATPKNKTRDMRDRDQEESERRNATLSPEIERLMHELQAVKADHEVLEKEMEHQKEELRDLRTRLKEAEDRRIEAPCDPTANEVCDKLKALLRESQAEREELQDRLEASEAREKELKRQLNAATLQLDNITDENAHLENRVSQIRTQLMDARLAQDQQSTTIEALRHQLRDARHHLAEQNAQTDEVDMLTRNLTQATRERDMHERNFLELQRELDEVRNGSGRSMARRERRDSGTELETYGRSASRRFSPERNRGGIMLTSPRHKMIRPATKLERIMFG